MIEIPANAIGEREEQLDEGLCVDGESGTAEEKQEVVTI
jgi:hypothetical protein